MSAQRDPAIDPEPFLPLAPRDVLILLALTEQPQHGYGLIKEAESLGDGRLRMDPANLYRALKKLSRDGLVEDADPAEDDGQRRRTYAITALGRAVVAAESQRLARLAEVARDRDLLSSPER
ncbi:MAG TPA: PadR family transcriptional regulator [Thermoanaerobaculia bacterium]|nr:PadR family transcriptional regulator [Thermoanaerobaculia bacterium]